MKLADNYVLLQCFLQGKLFVHIFLNLVSSTNCSTIENSTEAYGDSDLFGSLFLFLHDCLCALSSVMSTFKSKCYLSDLYFAQFMLDSA